MKDGIPATLIADNMAGFFMNRGEITCCVVGADRIAANGDTANKIGTYSVAVLAKENNIPFYVAAPVSTLDLTLSDGSKIPIEERPFNEVTHIKGLQLRRKGFGSAIRRSMSHRPDILRLSSPKTASSQVTTAADCARWRVSDMHIERFSQEFGRIVAISDPSRQLQELATFLESHGFQFGARSAKNILLLRHIFAVETLHRIAINALMTPSPDQALNSFERLAGVVSPKI